MSDNAATDGSRIEALERRIQQLEAQVDEPKSEGFSLSRRQTIAGMLGGGALLGIGTQPAAAATWSENDSDDLLESSYDGIDVGTVRTDHVNSIIKIKKSDTESDIQTKIDNASYYSVIEFPESTWTISNGLTIDDKYVTLRGTNESILQVADSSNLSGAIVTGTADHLTIDGLRFYGNTSNQSDPDASAIDITGKYATVRNCQIDDFWVDTITYGYGVHVASGGYARVYNNEITNVGRDHVHIDYTSTDDGRDQVFNNTLRRTKDNPYHSSNYQSYGVLCKSPQSKIAGNVIDWTGTSNNYQQFSVVVGDDGITGAGDYTQVVGNQMKESAGEHIYGKGEYMLVSGNEIHNGREGPGGDTSYNIAGNNSAFVGNVITGMQDYGIVARKGTLVGNNLLRNNEIGILAREDKVAVTGNKVEESENEDVLVWGADVMLSNNHLSHSNGSGVGIHIRYYDNSPSAFVASNFVDRATAIDADDDSTVWASNNFFTGTVSSESSATVNKRDNW